MDELVACVGSRARGENGEVAGCAVNVRPEQG